MKKNFSPCETAILKTLSYRAVFRYPLSLYQLTTYLVSEKVFKLSEIKQGLELLMRRHYIKEKNGLYSLYTLRTVDWGSRLKESEEIIKNNMETIKTLGRIPWILMIGISGSVAAHNATAASDVDIFIIVRKNRLWLTRLFVFLILKLLGSYPSKDGEAAKICPNLYIDEDRMAWKKENQNIYVAHDILLLQPLINKNNIYMRFIKANNWIFNFFGNMEFELPSRIKKSWVGESFLLDFIDTLLMKLQVFYMRKRKTTEIVHKNFLHFNKTDSLPRVLTEYKKLLISKKLS
jgi:hypothetical protein